MNAGAAPRAWRLTPLMVDWAILIAIETLGQVALKIAGNRTGALELDRASILAVLSTPWMWLGLACYLSQFVVWMRILGKSALSEAFPISAIAFVAVMIASWGVFGDPMDWGKILGSVAIVAGILLLGSDAQTDPHTRHFDGSEGKSA